MASQELEFVETVPQEMTCSICIKVLHQPHLVNCCEQHFCKVCLEEWLKNSQSCPHCRATSFTYMLMKQKSRKIGELKVYCPNRNHGCKAVLKYIDCDSHLSATNSDGCLYITLDCPNNCGTKVFRGKLIEHRLKLCPNRIVSCKYCKLKGKYHLMLKHVSECPLYPIACPKGCGVQIIPNDLQSHKSNCPNELVACTFHELGCKADICRKDMKKHLESTDHMSMIAESYIVLKEEHKILQKNHTTLAESCAGLQNGHATLHDSHISLQREHAALQAEHRRFKEDRNTLHDSHISLQREHAELQAEHRRFKEDRNKLYAKCTAIEQEFRALKIELTSSKSKAAKQTFLESSAGESSTSDLFTPACNDSTTDLNRVLLLESSTDSSTCSLLGDDSTADTDLLQATKSLPATKMNNSILDTSKQDFGSNLFLKLLWDESTGYHHIVLAGRTKLTLEWVIDDLFTDPREDVGCFQLRLYFNQLIDSQLCNVDVHATSGYGDSGQLAAICCGNPQTIMWEDKTTEKQLVGRLYLQCKKSDHLKVNFSHHQLRWCKCSCHQRSKDNN